MRLNKYIAARTELSRRAADKLVEEGRVSVNGMPAPQGYDVAEADVVSIDGKAIDRHGAWAATIILNKPRGYVCSRKGQGSKTVYELLPMELRHLNTVGRLDKDSSGLLLLTNDGELANRLTHPSFRKTKVYEVKLDKQLQPLHQQMISDYGIQLEDGNSKLSIERTDDQESRLKVTMSEGRNRQIRRTFHSLGYEVKDLHRITFGDYHIGNLEAGKFRNV